MARLIDISDLCDPQLTPVQRLLVRMSEAQEVDLSERSILEAAVRKTGLEDFGAPDFRERLRVWLEAIAEDAGATHAARVHLHQLCVRYAATRLRLEDFVRRHPESQEIRIDRPVVIAGLPRSGTTHLLRLLSLDERLRSLPGWESIEPIPHGASSNPQARWERADRQWHRLQALLPLMAAMHEVSPGDIVEDVELQAVDFSSYLPEWFARVPRWRDYYLAHDQTSTYRYFAKMLKVLTFLRAPNRWVTKCPQHLEQLPAIRTVFPDALVVFTHRDPVASIQSALTLICYSARVFRRRVDPPETAAYWIDRYEMLLRRCVRDRDLLPESQSVDVYFDDLVAGPEGVVREISEKAGLPLGPTSARQFRAYVQNNPRGKHGRIVYNLSRDFGLTPGALRERFQFYLDRFPARTEVS